MIERLLILWHFARTRWFSPCRDHGPLLRRFLRDAAQRSSFYQGLPAKLDAFPVMTKGPFQTHFHELNRHGITLAQATDAALRAEQERDFKPALPGGLTVGLSSGTSGTRQVFLVGRAERCRWAGQLLARMLSSESLCQLLNPFTPALRIALFLRANSNLYTTIASRRVQFAYYDLTHPFEKLIRQLANQQPVVLVAPATVLAELARLKPAGIRPSQVISVAEVLDERDRGLIEQAFGVRVGQIYQAAEGFLGCTCAEGRMHLNEDSLHIEPQWMDERRDRFQPLVTDFSRTTQWFIRYHLDDILRVSSEPCPCGRETMVLSGIEGRADEVLWASDKSGGWAPVFPDTLRQALYAIPEGLDLYRLEQHGGRWEIRLRGETPALRQSVASALEQLLRNQGLHSPELQFHPWTEQPSGEKQKRVRCVTRPA